MDSNEAIGWMTLLGMGVKIAQSIFEDKPEPQRRPEPRPPVVIQPNPPKVIDVPVRMITEVPREDTVTKGLLDALQAAQKTNDRLVAMLEQQREVNAVPFVRQSKPPEVPLPYARRPPTREILLREVSLLNDDLRVGAEKLDAFDLEIKEFKSRYSWEIFRGNCEFSESLKRMYGDMCLRWIRESFRLKRIRQWRDEFHQRAVNPW